MLDADPQAKGLALPANESPPAWRAKLAALRREAPAQEFARWNALVEDSSRTPESLRDALSTRLMEFFRSSESRAAFGLLYELNSSHLLAQVASCLRRYGSKADPRDVLQEVFFNIYRYPHRFNCEREDAFRVWTAMIVRNTVLKHLRAQGRNGRHEIGFEDLSDQPATAAATPVHGAIDREAAHECGRVYLTYLHLYLQFYSMLSPRERTAIHLVEVDERSYRDAAQHLGIKLENLKMVIFRARRKIHRAMRRVFDGLPHDCRPARDPNGRDSHGRDSHGSGRAPGASNARGPHAPGPLRMGATPTDELASEAFGSDDDAFEDFELAPDELGEDAREDGRDDGPQTDGHSQGA